MDKIREPVISQAIILAGGLGTRLRSIVKNVPKPMADIQGMPFLEHLMQYWKAQGINHFSLSIGYQGDVIKDYFGEDYQGYPIQYVFEDIPLGTGGGVKKALMETDIKNEFIVLLNGDTWYEAQLADLSQAAKTTTAPIMMSLKQIDKNDRYGGVTHDEEGYVIDFNTVSNTDQKKDILINAGCYLLHAEQMKTHMCAQPDKFSFENDFLIPMAKDRKIFGVIQNGKFLDIGIPKDYQRAQTEII